jgi:hypothetical protein
MGSKTISLCGAECMPMLAAIILYWIALGAAALVLALAVGRHSGCDARDAHYLAATAEVAPQLNASSLS